MRKYTKKAINLNNGLFICYTFIGWVCTMFGTRISFYTQNFNYNKQLYGDSFEKLDQVAKVCYLIGKTQDRRQIKNINSEETKSSTRIIWWWLTVWMRMHARYAQLFKVIEIDTKRSTSVFFSSLNILFSVSLVLWRSRSISYFFLRCIGCYLYCCCCSCCNYNFH